MLVNRTMPPSTVIPVLVYEDPSEAIEWLCDAFGFTVRWRTGDHRAQLGGRRGRGDRRRRAADRPRFGVRRPDDLPATPPRRGQPLDPDPGRRCRQSLRPGPPREARGSCAGLRTSRTASASTRPRISKVIAGRSRSRSPTSPRRTGAAPSADREVGVKRATGGCREASSARVSRPAGSCLRSRASCESLGPA